jgi:hypothetical protein
MKDGKPETQEEISDWLNQQWMGQIKQRAMQPAIAMLLEEGHVVQHRYGPNDHDEIHVARLSDGDYYVHVSNGSHENLRTPEQDMAVLYYMMCVEKHCHKGRS